jgi:hypothetical protein
MLVLKLEVLEIGAGYISCYHCTSMIESRRVADDHHAGSRLKKMRVEMSSTESWLIDAEIDADILKRLLRFRQE